MKQKTQDGEKKSEETLLVELPSDQIVIPTSQEFELSNRCQKEILKMPYAVKIFKFDKRNIEKFNSKNVVEQKKGYEEICKKNSSSKFLLHIQVKENSEFNNEQLKFIDQVQEFSDTPFHCVYEKSYKQDSMALKKQLSLAKKKYPNKEIISAVEVYTNFNDEKVSVMKELGISKCIVIYRNYERYETEWKELMGLLYKKDITKFILGVYPRMRRKNKASLLLAPLRWGANFVSHALPWSGGKGNVYLLGDNWIYNVTQRATYPLSRIEALNKANTLTPELKQLTVEQIKTLLY